ncbi:hypothetical protein LROSL1_0648 [Furfurilactobacillus rossiae]|uniref:GNAT family N-acetyltransferase n=1 Tax=Furfurilactobacillus rossiae TaxID=231049 RepID=UPI0015BF884C|nr:GNAT family N-acetyltransferase [Furfurilactobacillus rossiae]MCF6165652.1 GNAT family N-acetyltransferase [Furfurilactobacillus rossiae]QLE63468.1 hypothetical protein LROSL1_0648 [Furfurilactobacillus rossiae]
MDIRSANLGDVTALMSLNSRALGYSTDKATTVQALKRVLKQHDILLVAEDHQHVVGYVHATAYQTLYFAPLLNILGLAVLPEAQHQGIGQQLMQHLEQLGKQNGYAGIRLNSSTTRIDAHQFYEHLGYISNKTQKRFFKALN